MQRLATWGIVVAVVSCSDPAPTTGALIVDIAGLPGAVNAVVTVTGPNAFHRPVPSTTTLEDLEPGTYTVTAAGVTTPEALYQATGVTQQVSVVAGQTANAGVNYMLASGSIAFTISGLPPAVPPFIVIVGNGGYVKQVSAAGVASAIPPGTYIVRADTFASAAGDRYGSPVIEHPIDITASTTPIPLAISYALVSGTLMVNVSGLTIGGTDAITVTGPAGYLRVASVTTELRGLRPGTYGIAARRVVQCPTVFTPDFEHQSADITIGATTTRSVAYAQSTPTAATLNLSIASAHMAQAVQNADATLPIVGGKSALVRVFGQANQCNTSAPMVKLKFSDGDSAMIAAPETSVRLNQDPLSFTSSWNALIPPEKIQAGLSYFAEIDPGNAIAEADETDNRYPASGMTAVNVMQVAPFAMTFIPISSGGVTGNVTPANVPEYLIATNQLLPLQEITTTVAPTYTTSVNLGNGSSSAFISILTEIEQKRIADGSTSNYYGVVRPAPGVTSVQYGGFGMRPGRSAVSIQVGWFNSTRHATETVAHELSHNFNQMHAPCGAAGGPDPNFPHSGGTIGRMGYDVWSASILAQVIPKAPNTPDLMGYCQSPWISDYTYGRIMAYRGPAVVALTAAPARQQTLLVSGMIGGDSIALNPVFQLHTRPALPPASGPFALEARDANGILLFRTTFAGQQTDHGDPSHRLFAFAIPVSDEVVTRLASVELIADRRRASRRSGGGLARLRAADPGDSATAAGVALVSRNPDVLDLTWDATRWPAILVMDPSTNTLLAIARGGRGSVATRSTAVDLVLSDGARSTRFRARARGR